MFVSDVHLQSKPLGRRIFLNRRTTQTGYLKSYIIRCTKQTLIREMIKFYRSNGLKIFPLTLSIFWHQLENFRYRNRFQNFDKSTNLKILEYRERTSELVATSYHRRWGSSPPTSGCNRLPFNLLQPATWFWLFSRANFTSEMIEKILR